MAEITLTINGRQHKIDADPEMPLLWAIRDELGLTGTKFGCGIVQCGACTVHINGQPQRSCVIPVSSAVDSEITTIEGLDGNVANVVKAAWVEIDVPQCGYCQSGQVMSAVGLLSENSSPTDEDIDTAMAGNVCRCASYVRIRQAIKNAARKIEG